MKIRYLSVFLIMCFGVFSYAADQKSELKIPKANKPVNIDADLSEYGPPSIKMADKSFERLQYMEYGGKEDISADIHLLWDDENLYIGAKVTDDVPFDNSQEGPDIWNGDALELLLGVDEKADPERIYFGKRDYQIGLSPGNNKDMKPGEWVWRRDDYRSGIEVASKPWAKGYIIEAKVPFKVLGDYRPEQGKALDFDIAVDDSDAGKRDMQLAWTGTKEFYADPSQWGRATLGPSEAAFALSFTSFIILIIAMVITVLVMNVVVHRPR